MIPDYFEAITAYRCWVVHSNGLLVGQAHQEPWPPYAPMVGSCRAASSYHIEAGVYKPAPIRVCNCGIHAHKTLEQVTARVVADQDGKLPRIAKSFQDAIRSMWWGSRPGPDEMVWGTVKLWGRLIEHELGYRAEFAYPHELFCFKEDEAIGKRVAELYGVPVTVSDILEARKSAEDDGWSIDSYYSLAGSRVYFTPVTYDFWRNKPKPTPNPLITPPTFSQVRAVGASRFQKRQNYRASILGKGKGFIPITDIEEVRRMMKTAFQCAGVPEV